MSYCEVTNKTSPTLGELPVPPSPVNMDMDSSFVSPSAPSQPADDDEQYGPELDEPPLISPPELSDSVKHLELSKHKTEVLSSRLQPWNLLHKDANVTSFTPSYGWGKTL